MITVVNGQAILKARSLCGGNLPWVGTKDGEGVVILSQIPPGEPPVIPHNHFKANEIQSFHQCVDKYLNQEEIDAWDEYLVPNTDEPSKPFVLQDIHPIQQSIKVDIPQTVVGDMFKSLYKDKTTRPMKVTGPQMRRVIPERPPSSCGDEVGLMDEDTTMVNLDDLELDDNDNEASSEGEIGDPYLVPEYPTLKTPSPLPNEGAWIEVEVLHETEFPGWWPAKYMMEKHGFHRLCFADGTVDLDLLQHNWRWLDRLEPKKGDILEYYYHGRSSGDPHGWYKVTVLQSGAAGLTIQYHVDQSTSVVLDAPLHWRKCQNK